MFDDAGAVDGAVVLVAFFTSSMPKILFRVFEYIRLRYFIEECLNFLNVGEFFEGVIPVGIFEKYCQPI